MIRLCALTLVVGVFGTPVHKETAPNSDEAGIRDDKEYDVADLEDGDFDDALDCDDRVLIPSAFHRLDFKLEQLEAMRTILMDRISDGISSSSWNTGNEVALHSLEVDVLGRIVGSRHQLFVEPELYETPASLERDGATHRHKVARAGTHGSGAAGHQAAVALDSEDETSHSRRARLGNKVLFDIPGVTPEEIVRGNDDFSSFWETRNEQMNLFSTDQDEANALAAAFLLDGALSPYDYSLKSGEGGFTKWWRSLSRRRTRRRRNRRRAGRAASKTSSSDEKASTNSSAKRRNGSGKKSAKSDKKGSAVAAGVSAAIVGSFLVDV